MYEFVIGALSPMFIGLEPGEERRWAGTVHAVAATEHGPPFKTLCGRYVDFLNFGWEWPPEPAERSCPACVRVTVDPLLGVRGGGWARRGRRPDANP